MLSLREQLTWHWFGSCFKQTNSISASGSSGYETDGCSWRYMCCGRNTEENRGNDQTSSFGSPVAKMFNILLLWKPTQTRVWTHVLSYQGSPGHRQSDSEAVRRCDAAFDISPFIMAANLISAPVVGKAEDEEVYYQISMADLLTGRRSVCSLLAATFSTLRNYV